MDPEQLQRDLDWALHSPSLLAPDAQLTELLSPRTASPADPLDRLKKHFQAPPNHRVGKYFEALIEFWITQIGGYELVASNYQIQRDQRTQGELDFVFRDHEGALRHWETAVKFYLYDTDHTVHSSHYIGPNTNDTLERKIALLYGTQLPRGKQVFPDLQSSHALVKGRLFFHPNQTPITPNPPELGSDPLRGIWIRFPEIDSLLTRDPDARYALVQKPFWLSDRIEPTGSSTILSPDTLRTKLSKHFDQAKHTLLVAVLKRQRSAWTEVERCFVVHGTWPL